MRAFLTVALAAVAIIAIIAVAAPVAPATEASWLDAPAPASWNLPGQRVPLAPRAASPAPDPRCVAQYRAPSKSRADRAVAKAGWDLIGPLQVFGATELVTAACGADGMCRPLGYQAFVFVDGQFAGTLSPRPMDARTDGTASAIHLEAPGRLTVEYARYTDRDPLCCPSAATAVTFAVRRLRAGAVVVPVDVYTSPTAASPAPLPEPKPDRAPVNTYWKLTWLGDGAVEMPAGRTEPHLVLRTDGHTVDGSGGCNHLGGTYRLEGAALSFGPLATTKMMCDDTIEQERRFLAALDTVRGWRVAGDDLTLLDASGAPVARFVGVDLQ